MRQKIHQLLTTMRTASLFDLYTQPATQYTILINLHNSGAAKVDSAIIKKNRQIIYLTTTTTDPLPMLLLQVKCFNFINHMCQSIRIKKGSLN